MRHGRRLLASICMILCPFGVQADTDIPGPETAPELSQWYFGLGLGQSTLEPDTARTGFRRKNNGDFSYKVLAGYDLMPFLRLEAQWAELGTVRLDPYGYIDYSVISFSALYHLAIPEALVGPGWSVFAKGGNARLMTTGNVPLAQDFNTQMFFGMGAEYALKSNLALRFEVETFDDDAALTSLALRYYLPKRVATEQTQASIPKGPLDLDQDGIPDDIDQCPGTKPLAVVDQTGCDRDTDLDGVADHQDHCPATASGKPVDEFGCILPQDSDRDGVIDDEDHCPGTSPNDTVDIYGCTVELDTDHDGVIDEIDSCPDSIPGSIVDNMGCYMDSDEDEVHDHLDECPDTFPGMDVDSSGCAVLDAKLKGVHFKSGSAQLTADSKLVLNEVADVLKKAEGHRIQVQAHTDSQGSEADNLKLSKARARSVMNYLISKGISAQRLQSEGFGETLPIASNETAEGRALNRRVEFKPIRD